MSLLTPSESHAFQSFLSSMDPFSDAVAPEWSMYAHDAEDVEIPHLQGKEALAKATKDLMSLDGDRWSSYGANGLHQHPQMQHQYHQHPQQQQVHQHHPRQASYHHDVFPFLTNKSHVQSHHQHAPHLHPIAISPINALTPSSSGSSPPNTSIASSSTPSTSTTFTFPTPSPNSHSHGFPPVTPQSATAPPLHSRSPSSSIQSLDRHGQVPNPVSPTSATNRSRLSPQHAYTIAPSGSSASGVSTRHLRHHSTSAQIHQPSTAAGKSMPQNQAVSQQPQKPALLSPSQKKANHIQSEQKRRANIRRGYEALCDTVPALREAIRVEEEEMEQQAAVEGKSSGGAKRRSRKKVEVDGEKVDGRAGPRSENVVLSKTIDYITDLLNERSMLLARYNHACSSLPPGHHATQPLPESISDPTGVVFWEREWKGGEPREGEEGDDMQDDGVEEGSS
ncbi:hypothetical protein BDN72DRAFT_896572 [Pluteus cervinus]|uniref:Uncharacterized protein n=1 Tax=Pluteus cervinus TaxID=181527 RepID=A0ACD3AXA9_9AGAR|nr:hypothetical protein BDN72DRAFT_896572 [Pluteus cervinus]